ncbi:hypothetical protein AAVH_32142 [Aphelenchoides avenae]|nr:hypothetical protein AAVH_32142 [Aphelenchus avenae]
MFGLLFSILLALQVAQSVQREIVWQEDFLGTALDKTKWNVEVDVPVYNDEKQNYRGENVQVTGGNLVITAKKQSSNGQQYTSGRINTSNKFNFTYGYIESRMKYPLVKGTWPAFWTLGERNNVAPYWPVGGEIDIMEHVNDNAVVEFTMWWAKDSSNAETSYGTYKTIANPGDWHVYAAEWTPTYVKMFVDGQQMFNMSIADKTKFSAFHAPHHVLLNMAVGGEMPGPVIDDAKLPAQMLVDYVKVYKN